MRNVLKDYGIILSGTALARGIAFLNSIIIARSLNQEDFGRFSIFFVVMVLVWIFSQAFDSVFVRYAKTTNDRKEQDEFFKVAFLLKTIYVVSVVVFAYPLSYVLAHQLFYKPELFLLILVAMISGACQSFLMTVASFFQAQERFGVFSWLYAVYTILIAISLGLIKILNQTCSLEHIIGVHVVISLIVGFWSLSVLLKKKVGNWGKVDLAKLKMSLSLGKWIFIIEIVAYVFMRIDFLLLGRLSDFKTLGIYAVAQQIVMLVSVLVGSMSGVFFPKAAQALSSEEKYLSFRKDAFVMMLVVNSFVLVIFVISPWLIKVLFGAAYIEVVDIVRILLIGWFFYIIYLPFSHLFYFMNEAKMRLWIELLTLFGAIVLLYFFIRSADIKGAALAITISFILKSIVSGWFLQSKIKSVLGAV